ncbi:dihydroorotate dehydrogenase electron transfer subunit [Acutalibacter caecimuris]|uniref:dihydroorotate dehydrogenase electron transfer subunit n=1 Tax=Acutalibacter caecimuris TaxID=3093657 RepID=UPI002AC975AE|nr:dihydroorotate dehydrogenase electron transfer subunit [Acutalibacter sp. M00118]
MCDRCDKKPFDSLPCRLVAAEELAPGIFDFRVSAPQLAALAQPGQFAQIRLPGHTLRRPISLCGIDRDRGELRFVFQVRGQGTAELAAFRPGDSLEVLAPLGKGFPIDPGKKTLLLGGGIGVPPLLGAAEALGSQAVALLGFRDKGTVILEEDFRRAGAKVLVATDDGSYGHQGLVTELAAGEGFDVLFACGPAPMLKAAKALAKSRGAGGYLSLEQRMACGVGACLGCAVALLDGDGQTYYGHVCKDGPVLDMDRVAESAL